LLVADKPTGLLSVPTPKDEKRTLTSILNQDLEEKGLKYRLYPCHRLDRETSGLIIYAKSRSLQEKITELFRKRAIKKKYVAFIQGKLPKQEGEIKFKIEGKEALTKYKVLGEKSNYSIVEVMPQTGRTNQIRVHFKQIGHPLVGESKFAFRKDFALRFKRLCLHAQDLEFMHPINNKIISLHSDLPKDMQRFLSSR